MEERHEDGAMFVSMCAVCVWARLIEGKGNWRAEEKEEGEVRLWY